MKINDLERMIKGLKSKMEKILPNINKDINNIITNKIKDEKEIEFLLDTLLDYLELGIGEKEFKKLNEYYSTFNRKYSEFYNNYYKEMK